MKTATIARFVLGASAIFAAAGLVGCGAGEQGSGDPGAIGSTSEALSVNASYRADFGALAGSPVARWLSASCMVQDTRVFQVGHTAETRDVMIVATGYNSSGNGLADAYEYDPQGDQWFALSSVPSQGTNPVRTQERGEAQLVKLDDTSCLLVGGLSAKTGGAARNEAFKITTNGSTGTWATAGKLNVAHAQFAATKCGSNVIVIGGHTESGDTSLATGVNEIEALSGATGTTLWSQFGQNGGVDQLNHPIHSFAFAKKSDTEYVVAGGRKSAGLEDAVHLIKVTDNNCDGANDFSIAVLSGSTSKLTTARYGAAAIFTSSTDFMIAAGDNNSAVIDSSQAYTSVNWAATPPTATRGTEVTHETNLVAVRYPTVVVNGSAGSAVLLISGETHSSATPLASTPYDKVQEYSSGFGTATALKAARLGNTAQALNAKVYTSVGLNAQGTPPTLLTSTEEITP